MPAGVVDLSRARVVVDAASDCDRPATIAIPAGQPEKSREWSLVLASQKIAARTTTRDGVQILEVDPARAQAARAAIDAYEAENAMAPTAGVDELDGGDPGFAVGSAFGLALLAIHAASGGWTASEALFDRASADAVRILSGQWWRCFTALWLHADLPHVLGNALAGTYLVSAVSRRLGPGLAIALVLASGALGNASNAIAHAADHRSVGASTAVFGAIGLLAGIAAARPRTREQRRWLPLAAGLGLLAMLGTSGVRVDVLAHLFGLLAGCAIGAGVGCTLARRPSARAQWFFGSGALAGTALCWWCALVGI